MKRMPAALLIIAALSSGCAQKPTVPVAVSCPPSPTLPEVLKKPRSSGPSLSERIEDSFSEFERSVTKATQP